MIQSYIQNMLTKGKVNGKGGASTKSVRHHIVCLHTALQHAIKTGMLSRNPVDAVITPHVERHEIHTMSEADINHFLEASKATPYYSLFYTALFTGLRRSEILALRWKDVDLTTLKLFSQQVNAPSQRKRKRHHI